MAFPVIGSIVGGALGLIGANKAAKAQTNAANQASAVQQQMYNQTREDLDPFRQRGVNALARYADAVDQPFEETPGYQFRLQQGIDAVEASRAARGGLFSGATGKAINSLAQDYASNEYTNQLNRLQGLANMGQSAAAMQGTAGQNFASQQTNTLAGLGNAQAAGAVGMTNALNTGINNAIGYHQYNTLLDRGYFQ